MENCRLCNGELEFKFSKTVLKKHDVSYFKCISCESLQTEKPYWLNEAYSLGDIGEDTGVMRRNLDNLIFCLILKHALQFDNLLDYGASDGILCRMLRDNGLNAFAYDKFEKSKYAPGAHCQHIEILTMFEVLEHFSDPKVDLCDVLKYQTDYILASTEIYNEQGSDWPYLALNSGQHVFFYSVKGLCCIAEMGGYSVASLGSYFLFYKNTAQNISEKINLSRVLLGDMFFYAIKSHVLSQSQNGILGNCMKYDFDFKNMQ